MTLPQDSVEFFGEFAPITHMLSFVVDSSGNLIYDTVVSGDNTVMSRVCLSTGGVMSVDFTVYENLFVGLNGSLYRWDDVNNDIVKIKINPQDRIVEEEIQNTSLSGFGSGVYRLCVGEEIVNIGTDSYSVIYNDNDMTLCRSHSFPFDIPIVSVVAGEKNYYFSGRDKVSGGYTDKVIEVNLESGAYRELTNLSDYAVYQLSYSDGFLTFGAVKLSNGNSVIGKINPDGGKPEIISETTNGNITYLTPIN